MKRTKSRTKSKKRIVKKRKTKTYSKRKSNGGGIDLQKVVDFKFQTLGKIYQNFTKIVKRKRKKKKN